MKYCGKEVPKTLLNRALKGTGIPFLSATTDAARRALSVSHCVRIRSANLC